MSTSPFLDFAEQRDLDYAERVAPEAQGRFPLPHGETTDLVGGMLPGGYEGIVARLRPHAGDDDAPSELTLIATRIPESLDFARFIACFEGGFRGIASRAIGAGGLGWIREYTFESIEFNRRYRVAMLRTGKENRLRQLFSPSFLDWMADAAPEGLYWNLVSGVLTVTFDGGSVAAPADVERACELAGRIAERIRSEALEGTLGDDRDPRADAARAAAEAKRAEQIRRAGFASPPSDVASALDRLGPVLRREKGVLGRLFGSRKNPEAVFGALGVVLDSYAARAGLERDDPDALNEVLPFLDHFPMAVLRLAALHGALPATGAQGNLVAFLDFAGLGKEGGHAMPAFELERGQAGDAFAHVLPHDGRSPSQLGGFSIALGDGERRETETIRREREAAAALAESLDGRFTVVAHRPAAPAVGGAAQSWLASGAGHALVLENGKLTLVGTPRRVIEWSFDTLDAFCESAAPVIAET